MSNCMNWDQKMQNRANSHFVRLQGALGNALLKTSENRLKKVDYRLLESVFIERNEDDDGWRCEFWGKIVRSAILANHSLRDPELAEIIRKTAHNVMATQSPDGCISSYPAGKQTEAWDIWGRKYVLLALLRYYELVEADDAVLLCCTRMLDHLMRQLAPEAKDIRKCGHHGGLAASSILGAVTGVYRITGEKRFLDFAEYIVRSGCSTAHDIFASARAGVPPKDLGNGKAYEMTSCFQGLAELHLLAPRQEYLDACVKYFNDVRQREIFVTGVGGLKDCCGEYWNDGAFRQTRSDSGVLGETCVTTTYLHYCEAISRLIDSALPMCEAERSLYNGILGAMSPDATKWIHCNPTPLTGGGAKIPADDQILRGFGKPFGGNDCCLAQGPEALALAPRLALVQSADAVTLNFFEPLEARFSDGTVLEVSGNYPYEPVAEISVHAEGDFCLRLRVPSFCRTITLNGEPCDFISGEYLVLKRQWLDTDKLTMDFDFSLREVLPPDGSPFRAVLRGPIVMAEPSTMPATASVLASWRGRRLVDYASAGSGMCAEDTLTVWFQDNK